MSSPRRATDEAAEARTRRAVAELVEALGAEMEEALRRHDTRAAAAVERLLRRISLVSRTVGGETRTIVVVREEPRQRGRRGMIS